MDTGSIPIPFPGAADAARRRHTRRGERAHVPHQHDPAQPHGPARPAVPAPSGPLLMSLRMRAQDAAVPRARHALLHSLPDGTSEEVAASLELLVSELVTNAVRHVGEGRVFAVSLLRGEGRLRLAVVDSDDSVPEQELADLRMREARTAQAPDPDHLAESGRGLLLVGAVADSWGSYQTPTGKVVWCDVSTPTP
ncbi:ATP-binding protein [Allostreptomyces psammosilenae]|uniref:Anti-sigma regulatory factor (Ser/Thr protein kinase) n=1 Tax=Allostreptomyces psammosilenae TaxID=1892865 RepID=A0A852ZPA9_9ACTN|nr:ATP-binding protein [Allostreptomyces psammosilenae]NYI03307.1 anti-sigma regulatory factor (Ser/Thr protein kinase) [Allostreptomyces psammosilenae]